MSVCIICSAGGHLSEALAATSQVKASKYYVTFDEPHVRERLKDRKSTRLNSSHIPLSRMPSSA